MPDKFHQYHLTKTLSKKNSHTTYLASPISRPERQVVLTVFASLLFRFPHGRESLLQRAQHIKQLQHPHLVPILDMGIEEEQPFVVREYLPDDSLRSRLKQFSPNRLPLRDALGMVSQIGEALIYAHEHHIVHGNIKPENIFLDGNGQACLTDFYLVSRKDAIIRDQISEEYAFCYLAPEQFAGICDARSDQYALGCLTYELIAGRIPFAAQGLASMMGRPDNVLPAPLSESGADLPPSLEAAVLKALAKDPAERFFDFSLFLEVIKAVLSPPPTFPLARSAHSHKNRVANHPVQTAKAVDIASSTSRRIASPDPVSELPELSAAASTAENRAAEPVNTPSLSQISMPEWTGIIPFPHESLALALQSYQFTSLVPGETDPIGDRKNESPKHSPEKQEANRSFVTKPEAILQLEVPTAKQDITPWITGQQPDCSLLTNRLVQEETDALPAIDNYKSIHDYSEYATAEQTLALTRMSGVGKLHPVSLLHDRRRVLGLVVLISVVVALIGYIFLPLVMTMLKTSSYTANKKQGVIPQVTTTSTAQVSAIPTTQPSVTNTPTAQPTMPVTNIAPSAVMTTLTSYEAEASQNTIADGAKVITCSGCSGGYKVGYLGMRVRDRTNTNGTLQINNVNESTTGNYRLTIYYINGSDSSRSEYISVDGGSAIVFNGSPTGSWDTVGAFNIVVSLHAGNNTIEFFNPHDKAPDIDRIVV